MRSSRRRARPVGAQAIANTGPPRPKARGRRRRRTGAGPFVDPVHDHGEPAVVAVEFPPAPPRTSSSASRSRGTVVLEVQAQPAKAGLRASAASLARSSWRGPGSLACGARRPVLAVEAGHHGDRLGVGEGVDRGYVGACRPATPGRTFEVGRVQRRIAPRGRAGRRASRASWSGGTPAPPAVPVSGASPPAPGVPAAAPAARSARPPARLRAVLLRLNFPSRRAAAAARSSRPLCRPPEAESSPASGQAGATSSECWLTYQTWCSTPPAL